MTELNLSPNPDKAPGSLEHVEQPRSRWKGPIFSVLLSLLFPGLGQWRNRQPWKGLAIAALGPFLTMAAGYTRIFLSFRGMIGFLTLTIVVVILVGIDSFRNARTPRQSRKSFAKVRLAFSAAGVMILAFVFVPSTDFWLRKFGYFRAFKVPSASMCPTICEGDRIVANMYAFIKSRPSRGDIIMMKHETMDALLIKRIVGVEGDVVSTKDGQILVNGQPFAIPSPAKGCQNTGDDSMKGEPLFFDPVKVPASSFFVVGDNLPNSYDSRIQGFGFVSPNQVRGQPVYIYWSRVFARIGCSIR